MVQAILGQNKWVYSWMTMVMTNIMMMMATHMEMDSAFNN
jgi:hypothetical protein